MQKLLLLGAEAIAQGAIDGGMSGVYAYPGTPSTEITEYVQNNKTASERKIHSQWSANEKTAMEAALGMSYAGRRAMVCMKHVGLNVAADAFINSAITGVNGGLIVTVADDPSMHSSQNEQDSRFYGKFAMIPILEPSNQQEAYDMAYEGFELSEKFKLPVLLRFTTRLSHSRSGIQTKEMKSQNSLIYPEDPIQFVLLPSNARKRYKGLLAVQDSIEDDSEKSKYNIYYEAASQAELVSASDLIFELILALEFGIFYSYFCISKQHTTFLCPVNTHLIKFVTLEFLRTSMLEKLLLPSAYFFIRESLIKLEKFMRVLLKWIGWRKNVNEE